MPANMKINEKNLTGFAMSNSPIDKDGWLLKRGEVNKSFQRRWFVLKGNLLFYLEKKTDREPSGLIILEGCTIELAEYEEQYAFKIVFHGAGDRTYVLGADTQETMESWMKALACASYDYMKLMVSELQRQLDEIVELEKAHVSIFDPQKRTATTTTSEALQSSCTGGTSASNCYGAEATGLGFGVLASVTGGVQCRRSPVAVQHQRINPFNRCQSDDTYEKPNVATVAPGSAPGTPQHQRQATAKSATSFKNYQENRHKVTEEVLVKSPPTPNASCRLFAAMHERHGLRILVDITAWRNQTIGAAVSSIPVGQLISLDAD